MAERIGERYIFDRDSMIQPNKPDRDLDGDEDLEPPARGAAVEREEETWSPDDDSDLDLADDGDVGLDADTGLDEGLDGELADVEDEPGTWLDDGAARESDELDDGLDGADDDESWTEGGEATGDASSESWDDAGIDLDDAPEVAAADTGEEGFGDDGVLAGIDVDRLPPLDDGGEAPESDAFGAALLDELSTGLGGDEALVEIGKGLRVAALPASRVELRERRRTGRPLQALCGAGELALAWDQGLWLGGAGGAVADQRAAAGEVLRAFAALRTHDAAVIAIATPEGIVCSRDGGQTFASPRGLGGDAGAAAALALTASGQSVSLWAAPPDGPLFASDDFGASFRCVRPDLRVLRLAADGKRELLVTARGEEGRARVLRTSDGGRSFAAVEVPVEEVERVQDMQICCGVTLCSRRAPSPQLVWKRSGQNWIELAKRAAAPACLVAEDGEASAYFCAHDGARSFVLRRSLGGREAPPELVVELPADAGLPLQLHARSDEGLTTIELGTERAWYVIELRLDAAGRA